MRALIALIALVLLIYPANAVVVRVEEVSNFKVTFNADNGHFKCDVTIKNLVKNPIVPGIGEIRLQKQEPIKIAIFPIPNTKKLKAVNVSNVKAYSGNANIPVKVLYKENYTVIQYEIWTPIEPGKTFNFTLEFDAPELVDRGIVFKSVTIPIGSDVDIERLELKPVSSWHICYSNPSMESDRWIARIPADHIAFFTVEFSMIPLPMLPIRGYLVFWGLMIVTIASITLAVGKRQKNAPK